MCWASTDAVQSDLTGVRANVLLLSETSVTGHPQMQVAAASTGKQFADAVQLQSATKLGLSVRFSITTQSQHRPGHHQ
jgi:hypothetical protein